MTKYAFTGPKEGCDEDVVLKVLDELNLTQNDTVITGACIGLDSQVSHLVRKHYPLTKQIIVVPSNRKYVDTTVFVNGLVIEMSNGSSYRDRNEEMVRISEKVTSFWNGNKRSGTFMTMNIAKRHNKLYKIVNIRKVVYLVNRDNDRSENSWALQAIFSTKEKAEKYVKDCFERCKKSRYNTNNYTVDGGYESDWDIEEYAVDEEC